MRSLGYPSFLAEARSGPPPSTEIHVGPRTGPGTERPNVNRVASLSDRACFKDPEDIPGTRTIALMLQII